MKRNRTLCCAECGAVFSPWEEMYSWDKGMREEYVCEACFDALFDELSRHERAELIGSEVRCADGRYSVPPS